MCRPALCALILLFAAGCSSGPPSASVPATGADIPLRPDTTLIKGLVPRNTTLNTMLRGHGVAADAAERVVAAAARVFDPRRLRSLQPFALERTIDGALRVFEYEIDPRTFLRIAPAQAPAGELRAEVLPIPRTLTLAAISGRIDQETSSLFASIDAAGEGAELAMALAGVFGGEIDFNTELQPGDSYAVAFERYSREGGADTYGNITAAEFRNDGRVLRAIRFTPPGGAPAFYDEQGKSLRRFFLRSPLKFEPRVTSGFSLRRMHPVLHTARAHRGVDYGAPQGAPVIAVASGTVLGATFDNTNGRMVRIRHASGYESYYLHLSAFASGLRAGVRVAQGDTIGRVGATGLATGPHLHYGLRKNGEFVNPLREHRNMPPGEPVPASAMEAFAAARDEALARLGSTRPRSPSIVFATQ